jgi:hypothetical protein
MDERELIRRYLQQQQPPILDDIMPQDKIEFECAAAVHSGKVIDVQGGRFHIDQSEQNAFK